MITVHPILHQTPLIGGRMKMICDHAKGCKVISCPDIVGHFENARCKPQKCYELEAQVACVPVDSLLEKSKENNRRFGAKDSKPKEELSKGFEQILNTWVGKHPSYLVTESHWYGLRDEIVRELLICLSSHGFGDIEQAKKEELARCAIKAREERERIAKKLTNWVGGAHVYRNAAQIGLIISELSRGEALKQEGK